jgi:hypothetical protein
LWAPFIFVGIGVSRLLARFDRAKKLAFYALLIEGLTWPSLSRCSSVGNEGKAHHRQTADHPISNPPWTTTRYKPRMDG